MTAGVQYGGSLRKKVQHHQDLQVYRRAFDAAMRIFELTQAFPKEEKYSLVDQIRRCSRSVCANIAEAWWKRRYEAAFISKICDAQGEAAETQVWIEFAVRCGYLDRAVGPTLYDTYNAVLGTLVGMAHHPETWILTAPAKSR
jgi:four helix bundle protein